jgi:hypothetical protein
MVTNVPQGLKHFDSDQHLIYLGNVFVAAYPGEILKEALKKG